MYLPSAVPGIAFQAVRSAAVMCLVVSSTCILVAASVMSGVSNGLALPVMALRYLVIHENHWVMEPFKP
ncbi:hypothetical protein D3C76_1063820 [compost metagenome]